MQYRSVSENERRACRRRSSVEEGENREGSGRGDELRGLVSSIRQSDEKLRIRARKSNRINFSRARTALTSSLTHRRVGTQSLRNSP